MEAISIKAEELFEIGGITVTNSLFLTLLVSIMLIVGAFLLSKRVRLVPALAQSAVEMGMEWFLGITESTLGGSRAQAEKYFPLVATIFIFILFSNLFGILPGVGSITFRGEHGAIPLLRSPAADLNFTLAFAVISVALTNIIGASAVGIWPHISKFFNFKNPIMFFIGILELISEFAKILSLSFRLFGNVFAGEVLLTIIFFLVPYILPLPFLLLELFVGLIQAFLFAMLTLVSISLHTAVHGEH